jgi:hypothetical protein
MGVFSSRREGQLELTRGGTAGGVTTP